MLATLIDKPFDSKDFIFEIKWDGFRALASVKNGKVDLYSRNFKDFNQKYPSIVKRLEKVKENVIFDGEIIAYQKDGSPSFQLLQNLGSNPGVKIEYVIFDLLQLNGKNLMNEPLHQRRAILQKILKKYPALTLSLAIENEGKKFFEKAVQQNLEGVMAKKKDSLYTPGHRSEAWLKIKHHKTDEGIIAGFTKPRGSRRYFGALVLGQYKHNDEFTFIGHTGTGFNEKTLQDVYNKMKSLITKNSPFKTKVPLNAPITWVKPKLVASLKFTEWTQGGNMRHPVFLGLREDKSASEVKKEKVKKI